MSLGPTPSVPCPQPHMLLCSLSLPPLSGWASCFWRSPDLTAHPQHFPVPVNPLLASFCLVFGKPELHYPRPQHLAPCRCGPPPSLSPATQSLCQSSTSGRAAFHVLLCLLLRALQEEDHEPQTHCCPRRCQPAECPPCFSGFPEELEVAGISPPCGPRLQVSVYLCPFLRLHLLCFSRKCCQGSLIPAKHAGACTPAGSCPAVATLPRLCRLHSHAPHQGQSPL